jgi:hypothetical protein
MDSSLLPFRAIRPPASRTPISPDLKGRNESKSQSVKKCHEKAPIPEPQNRRTLQLGCDYAALCKSPNVDQDKRSGFCLLRSPIRETTGKNIPSEFCWIALLAAPDRLAQLTANAKRLGRPQAAFDVARAALDWPLQPK